MVQHARVFDGNGSSSLERNEIVCIVPRQGYFARTDCRVWAGMRASQGASWVDGEVLSGSRSMPLAAAVLARAKRIRQIERSMTREDRALGEAEVLLML
jgi:hypothetical protein